MRTAIEILKEGATIMQQAMDGPISDQQRREVIASLKELNASDPRTWSMQTISRTILRASPAVWTQIAQGKYRGRGDKYLRNAMQWFADQTQRQALPATDFVETRIASMILRVCHRAWTQPCIGKICLPSGTGKTYALREYARRRNMADQRAVYFQAGEAYRSKTGFLPELARKLSIRPGSVRNLAYIYQVIRERLAAYYDGGRAAPMLLIVDEATTLLPCVLNMLRNLHDDDECRLAVVLADTARLDVELSGMGMAGGYEQLRSRFGAVYAPQELAISRDDVAAVAGSVARSLGFDGKLQRESIAYLCQLAAEPGALRNVVYRLQTCHDLAEQCGGDCEYSVAQLDFAGELTTGRTTMAHSAVPFGTARAGDTLLRTA